MELAQRGTLEGGHTDHGALNCKDRIYLTHGLGSKRRMGELGEFEQLAPAMGPAPGLDHRPGMALRRATYTPLLHHARGHPQFAVTIKPLKLRNN